MTTMKSQPPAAGQAAQLSAIIPEVTAGDSHRLQGETACRVHLYDLNGNRMSAATLCHGPQHPDTPPAGSVEIPTAHWLELRAWKQPNGARFVQLVDESEETWESYCRMIAKRNTITATERKTP